MTSVLVVHSQSLHRVGLHMLLAAEPDLSVVGTATSGTEAIRMSAELSPDVVVIGSHVADPNGVDAIRRITRPLTPIPAPESVRAGGRPRAYWS